MTLSSNPWVDDAGSSEPVPSVLIVDDSLVDRRLAGEILSRAGEFRVSFAEDGLAALELIEIEVPDLVVTDLQMPEFDGHLLVEALRNRTRPIPAIVMTAHGSEEIALQAIKNGAASYVPKRNLVRDLVGAVRDVLACSQSTLSARQLSQCWTASDFHFELGNDTALIPTVVSHLQRYLGETARSESNELVRIGVALHEALRNAIHHGNLELSSELRQQNSTNYYALAEQRAREQPYEQRRVFFATHATREETRFVVRDEGPGFDPSAVLVDPGRPENLLRFSGRGLFLIQSFMNQVEFNDRGNEITMIRRSAAMSAAGNYSSPSAVT